MERSSACFVKGYMQYYIFLTAISYSFKMLKQPDHVVLNDFKQQRAAALDPQLISHYEELVTEWMNTIEAVLTDTSDER